MMKELTSIALNCSGGPSIILDDYPLIHKFFKLKNFPVICIIVEVNLKKGHRFLTSHLTDFKGGGEIY